MHGSVRRRTAVAGSHLWPWVSKAALLRAESVLLLRRPGELGLSIILHLGVGLVSKAFAVQLLEILVAFIICHNLQNAILQTKSKNPITSNIQLKACFD